jgi:hypothetical protein
VIRLRLALCAIVVALSGLAPAVAAADHTQQSIFQDDQYLLYSPSLRVNHTLALLKDLGVDRVRVNVDWSTIAPDPLSATAPPASTRSTPRRTRPSTGLRTTGSWNTRPRTASGSTSI